MSMTLCLNGKDREFSDLRTLSELLAKLEIDPASQGVAVALNNDVISRKEMESTTVKDGDRIEIVQAVQGG